MENLLAKKCVPCEGGTPPLKGEQIQKYLDQLKGGWEVEGEKEIQKKFNFKSFRESIDFVNRVANLAEEENHHPDIHIRYRNVTLDLSTHAIGGLSENDFILASKIDLLYTWNDVVRSFLMAKLFSLKALAIYAIILIILLFLFR